MPWGLEYNDNFDYPVQESYQNNLAQSYAPAFQTPAMDNYMSYLNSSPNPNDYQGGFWSKLLAGISGAATGIKTGSPLAGMQTSLGIMDAPYLRALNQYQSMEPGLRQAASIEERSLGDRMNVMRYQQQGMLDRQKMEAENRRYANELQFKYADLDMRRQTALANARNDAEKLAIDQAYNNARIAVDQESNRIREWEAQNRQYGSMEDYIKNFGTSQKQPQMSQWQFNARLMADPMFMEAFKDGQFNPSELDPDAFARYQEIAKQYGAR